MAVDPGSGLPEGANDITVERRDGTISVRDPLTQVRGDQSCVATGSLETSAGGFDEDSGDRLSCGPGRDRIEQGRPHDFVTSSCESAVPVGGAVLITVLPGGRLLVRIRPACRCSAVTVRSVAADFALLGRRRFAVRRRHSFVLQPTPLGRRRVAGAGLISARIQLLPAGQPEVGVRLVLRADAR